MSIELPYLSISFEITLSTKYVIQLLERERLIRDRSYKSQPLVVILNELLTVGVPPPMSNL